MSDVAFEIAEVAAYEPRREPSGCELCGHCRMLREALARRALRLQTALPPQADACRERP